MRDVPGLGVGGHVRAALLERGAVTKRAVADARDAFDLELRSGRGPRLRRRSLVKTSRRPASITGSDRLLAARASSVETPATGTFRASAKPRARASPRRVPVKLPGPVPTTSAVMSFGVAPSPASSSSASASTRNERVVRSASGRPSSTSATVATCVAVSNARTRPTSRQVRGPARSCADLHPRCAIRTVARGAGNRPAPASGHSTKTIASSKYGSRSRPVRVTHLCEPVQVEVGDGDATRVAVADRVRRARHRLLDAERATGAAHERRLARAQLARDRRRRRPGAGVQPARAPACLGLPAAMSPCRGSEETELLGRRGRDELAAPPRARRARQVPTPSRSGQAREVLFEHRQHLRRVERRRRVVERVEHARGCRRASPPAPGRGRG